MVKFIATSENGRKILGIVLVRGNLNYLVEDKPIHFNAEEMGLPEIKVNEIMIQFFETEEECKAHFKEIGFITDETPVRDFVDRYRKN